MPAVEHAGAQLHYTCKGRGPFVLLVQGVGVVGEGWRPQINDLVKHFTVVSFDNRGLGRSTGDSSPLSIELMAADACAVADAVGARQFHLAGHSMGGLIAQHVALTAPARVLSLALLCTFLNGRQGATMSWPLFVSAMRSRIGTRRMRRHAFVEIVMPPAYLAGVDRDRLCDELKELFGRDLADQPPIVMRQVRAMARFDASVRLAELGRIPTLVLSAEYDRIAPPAYGRALAAAIPGARYSEIAGAGHAVTIQCARVVNDILLDHLGQATGVMP